MTESEERELSEKVGKWLGTDQARAGLHAGLLQMAKVEKEERTQLRKDRRYASLHMSDRKFGQKSIFRMSQ